MSKLGISFVVAITMLLGAGMGLAVDVLEREAGAKKLPVNVKCPMSGRAVDPEQTTTYQNEVIGFCCGDCKGNFEEDPAANIDKVERLTVNLKCPMSGRDINPAKTVVYEGRTIGFCCDNCKGNFEEDPAAAIGDVKYEPINSKCPMSGRDINPEKFSIYQSRVVGFCCDNCKGNFEEDPAGNIGEVKIDRRR